MKIEEVIKRLEHFKCECGDKECELDAEAVDIALDSLTEIAKDGVWEE